jgi:predicted RNA-binding protein YlxR (DUF448 family)
VPRSDPRRTCVATRAIRSPDELIRFVLGPDGAVVPDLRRKLPGRGVWVTATQAAVDETVKRRLFPKGFKAKAQAAPDLGEAIASLMRQDLRQALALANKAGCVVTGFGKVESAIGSGGVAALIHAAEAKDDGRRKLAAAVKRRYGEAGGTIPVVDDLPGEELDLALGRSHVIHAALVAGAGSDGFLMRWRKLRVYRGDDALPDAPLDEDDGAHDHEPAGN